MKKAPNKVYIIDDDVDFFNTLKRVVEKESQNTQLIQIPTYKEFLECSQVNNNCQSTLLAVIDKMMGDQDISVEASNHLNALKIPHILLSSNQVSVEDFKIFKKNKHCLNLFLKDNMQSIVFQLLKSIDNARQHNLQIHAIETARAMSIAQGLIMGKSGLTQAVSEQKIKALAEAEGVSIKEVSNLILRLHEVVNS